MKFFSKATVLWYGGDILKLGIKYIIISAVTSFNSCSVCLIIKKRHCCIPLSCQNGWINGSFLYFSLLPLFFSRELFVSKITKNKKNTITSTMYKNPLSKVNLNNLAPKGNSCRCPRKNSKHAHHKNSPKLIHTLFYQVTNIWYH